MFLRTPKCQQWSHAAAADRQINLNEKNAADFPPRRSCDDTLIQHQYCKVTYSIPKTQQS